MLDLVTLSENNQPVTTSVKIAEVFGKEHKTVIRAINNIIGDLRNLEDTGRRNFVLSSYINLQGKEQKQYIVTRDGFTLLAMGFTGKKALEFKLRYISEFNRMEALLRQKIVDTKAIGGIVKRCAAVAIRDELEKIFDKCLTSDLHIRGEVSDSDLMLCLHHWFATRQKKVFDNLRELTRENESLKTKLLTIKQALK